MKTSLLSLLTTDLKRDRLGVARGLLAADTGDDGEPLPAVDHEGGSRGAGLIRGASLIQVGEALGHDAYVDETTIQQVVELANQTDNGIKVRFTHPGMSSDGLGSYLGRAKNLTASEDGTKAYGDVHFSPTSRREGEDRGGYVLDLAADDPASFGMSIVFDHDLEAESNFVLDNSAADEDGQVVFTSPAEMNTANHPHVRLAALHGADFVDSPAANADGLFGLFGSNPSIDLLSQAEDVFEYVLGLRSDAPEDTGGLSVSRLRGFCSRFFSSRQLQLIEQVDGADSQDGGAAVAEEKEVVQVEETEAVEASTEPTREDVQGELKAELKRFTDKFGDAAGAKYFLDGVSFEDALSSEYDKLQRRQVLGTGGDRGETEPVGEYGEGDSKKDEFDPRIPKATRGLMSAIKMPR